MSAVMSYPWRICSVCWGYKKNTPGEFALCARDKSYHWQTKKWFTVDKKSKNLKKNQKNSKNGINIEKCKYTIFLTILSHLESPQFTLK
jgi:hypothetical protein